MGTLFWHGHGVYMICFFERYVYSRQGKRRFYSILSAGMVIMFSFQTLLILGGVTKLIPLTGVTLPFVSYGGSSVRVSVALVGLCSGQTVLRQGEGINVKRGRRGKL